MTLHIATPTEVVDLVNQSFAAVSACNAQRVAADIAPPAASPTADRIFNALTASEREFNVAFVDAGPDQVISCYDDTVSTVFIRADKTYVLTEYDPPVPMPFEILLYHELGHAKQYLDGAGPRLTAEDSSRVYIGGNTAGWQDGQRVLKPRRGPQTQYQAHGYAANLETNNMRNHEWPIARELGVPVRSTYLDIAEG